MITRKTVKAALELIQRYNSITEEQLKEKTVLLLVRNKNYNCILCVSVRHNRNIDNYNCNNCIYTRHNGCLEYPYYASFDKLTRGTTKQQVKAAKYRAELIQRLLQRLALKGKIKEEWLNE